MKYVDATPIMLTQALVLTFHPLFAVDFFGLFEWSQTKISPPQLA